MPDARTNHPTPHQLANYRLGKLPAAERASIHAHVAGCPECRRKVETQSPDSSIGKHREGAPASESILPTIPPSASSTALPVRGPAEAKGNDVPAELLGSPKFEILSKLGQGGMGAVYKARHTFLGDTVAIKVMTAAVVENPEARSRFLREMLAAGQLKHPNIVRALDAEQIGDLLVLVMEFVPGITLDRLVKQRGPLPVDFACQCIMQAALGLQHAHEKGMVHRDIKPANLMVTAKEKEIKVLDFGLVRGPRGPGEKTNQTQLQTFMGTPEYVSPEQATDARSADIRADVYSLGCTLYFLLAGRPPFQKETILNMIMAQMHDEAQPLTEVRKDVPAELAAVVAMMMAKKPIARYQTPIEAARALKRFVGEGPAGGAEARPAGASAAISPGPPPPPARIPPIPARHKADETPFGLPPVPSSSRRENAKTKRKRPAWMVAAVAACGLAAVALTGVVVLTFQNGKGKEVVKIDPKDAPVVVEKGKKGVVPVQKETTKPVAVAGSKEPPLPTIPAPVKPGPVKPRVPDKDPPIVSPAAITNSIGMTLMRIPAGKFTMGSPKKEQDATIVDWEKWTGKKPPSNILSLYRSEGPRHEVEITKEFWIGSHEVTQGQFRAVMGYNPSFYSTDGRGKSGVAYTLKPGGGKAKVAGQDTSDFPVENVSFPEAMVFCANLSARLPERGRIYRLPSEAEWEYACRGGDNSSLPFHYGNSLSSQQANFNGNFPYGGAAKAGFLARTCKVGSYKSNAFGLFDMHGNVWEWCADWYGSDYYANSPLRDPPGPPAGSNRGNRGGGWADTGQYCRSAFRDGSLPPFRINTLGFRVVLIPSSR